MGDGERMMAWTEGKMACLTSSGKHIVYLAVASPPSVSADRSCPGPGTRDLSLDRHDTL